MVPEETCVDCVRIATSCDSDKTWISGINSITKDKLEIHCEAVCDTSDKIRARNYGASEEDVRFIKGIVLNLCDSVVPDSVKMREVKLDRAEVYRRKSNRRASLIDQDLKNNTFVETINPLLTGNRHRRALSECILEKEPEDVKYFTSKININLNSSKSVKVDNVQKPKVPRKKKFSFNSFFHKKDKHRDEIEEEHIEEYDKFDSSQSVNVYKPELAKLKKAYSALELNQKTSPLQRTNSFIKKLVNLGGDSSSLLKRSFSVRDFSKKKDKEKVEKHVDTNEQKWRQSLQSLVETDISVSYNDLSYIDYNALNDISYEEETGSQVNLRRNDSRNYSNIERTQSMFVKSSPQLKRPSYLRIASTSEERPPDLGLSAQSGATSLPSLCHFNIQENGSNIQEPLSPTPRLFQRRPQSISSEDGARSRSSASGSFRSAGSGCAKLKRHNACRQKNRNAASLTIEIRNDSERKVRSRSLNHLDTLDMRQGIISTADAALKDSRSEPDCTKPILPPPALNPEPPTPTTDVPPARKHMLSRSQKSSSECFTVNFEVGVGDETWDNELFFPAQRGFTLLDHIGRMCESHNIDLSTCEARLLDKENNSETLIPFTQDTANLVGRHIRITAKDSSNKKLSGPFHSNHSRKQSGSYRTKPSSYFSSSTEESTPVATSTYSLHDADQKKQIKQRFTAFFANAKDTKLEALVEQLDKYTKQGIPSNPNYRKGQCESVDALYKLEDDWKDIVEFSDLNEKQQQQQTVLWELIKTEVAYIKMLKVVTDLFLACLKDLQSKSHLKEIDTVKLFSNITEILDANVIFWRNTLFPLVKNMRQYKRPPCIESMLEGFSQIHEVFQPYYIYCAEQSRCQHYCRENLDSEFFTAYLTWCESQKDCNRLRLMDILVQPMQRLTKYGLLLKAVLKNTEEDVEKESLSAMIKMVDEFVNSVNLNLKHRQDSERLKGIIARIESYDVVESKDDDVDKLLKSSKLMQLDLNKPMINCPPERKRHLLLEGDLKLKDNLTSKMEVHCFLLTDMLLICKPSTKKGGATVRVVRQPYLVDRLVVHELARETPSLCVVYKNEFDMAVAVFILQSNDPRKLKGWKDGILKAQALYKQAKQTRQSSSFADESMDAEYYTDFSEFDLYHSLQLAPRSPLASSSRASRVSSLAHSHSGSVEMNDQSSVGSAKDPSRGVSVENDNRTASISSDEGVQPLPPDKSPVSQKNSFKNRLFPKTPNTLSVQPYGSLGQSLPNLTLGSPNIGGLSLNLNQNTLSVPSSKNGGHLLSPTHRGVSYPPPSPTRGNLRRSLAISQNKNPPLIKTRQVNSASSVSQQMPTSFDFDVPVIAGVSRSDDHCESFSRGSHRQAMKRTTRYHTAGVVDDIKKNDNRDATIHKRLSWNCTSQEQRPPNEDQT